MFTSLVASQASPITATGSLRAILPISPNPLRLWNPSGFRIGTRISIVYLRAPREGSGFPKSRGGRRSCSLPIRVIPERSGFVIGERERRHVEERIIRTLEDEGWLFELLLYDLPVCEKQDAIQDLKFGLIEEVDSKKRVLPFESYYYPGATVRFLLGQS